MNEDRVFGVNPGESEEDGLIRTTNIMKRAFKYWDPRTSNNNLLMYSLMRDYKGRYEAAPKKKMMLWLLQYPEVAEIYKMVLDVTKTSKYRVAIAMIDDGLMI